MPTAPLLECTFPGCRKRQRESRCVAHRNWRDYRRYRNARRALLLAHLKTYGLWCPGAEDHPGHAVEREGDLTVDHIRSRVRGGGHDKPNLRVLCGSYNSRRGARRPTMIDYRSEMRLRKPEPAPSEKAEVSPPPRMRIVKVQPPRPTAEKDKDDGTPR